MRARVCCYGSDVRPRYESLNALVEHFPERRWAFVMLMLPLFLPMNEHGLRQDNRRIGGQALQRAVIIIN